MDVEGDEKCLKCRIFEKDLLQDNPFRKNLGRRENRTMKEILNKDESFINLEEKLHN